MAKRNIKEEFNSVTFPDRKEYQRFEELGLSGTVLGQEEAFFMLKTKTEAKRRKTVQVQRSQRE